MSEDARIDRASREEQDELDRAHGQHLLDIAADARERRRKDPLLEVLHRAHQAQAEADKV